MNAPIVATLDVGTLTGPRFAALPPLALYVHIPWCLRKCPYCDFNSHEARGDVPEARYIAALAEIADRRAHYACVLALTRHAADPEPIIAEGVWHGTIIDTPRGTGGFGYDPHFLDNETGLTGAELPLERKNELSHRGKAMRALIARLEEERA